MQQLFLKNLLLSSLFVVFISSCSPTLCYKKGETKLITEAYIHPIVNRNNSLLYKANIKLYTKYFSGLILLKQTDSSTSHLVFVTELGMKMFDYEIKNNQFKLTYVFEPLNKPKVLSLLESDLKLALLQNLLNKEATVYEKGNGLIYKVIAQKQKGFYYVDKSKKTVSKTKVKGPVFSKEKVDYTYNDSLSATQIKLKHNGLIRLKIELNKILK